MRRIGRRQADERDRDRRAVRLVVVERHLHRAALERARASRSTCSNRSLPSRRSPCRPLPLRRRIGAPRTPQLRRVSSSCPPLSRPRACRPLPNGHRAAKTILLRTEDVNGARRERVGRTRRTRAHGRCLRWGLVAASSLVLGMFLGLARSWPSQLIGLVARVRGPRARQCGQLRALLSGWAPTSVSSLGVPRSTPRLAARGAAQPH